MRLMHQHKHCKYKTIWSNLVYKHAAFHFSGIIIKRAALIIPFLLSLLILSPTVPVDAADDNQNTGIKVYCNGDFRGSTAYIDPDSGAGMVPLALIQNLPGLRLDVRDKQAWFALNDRKLSCTVGSTACIIDGHSIIWRSALQPWQYGIAVPARDLFEALGADVRWNDAERAIYITTPLPAPTVPENLSPTSLPLHIAFIQDEQLWMLDASKPGAQPFLVLSRNMEQIIGWSHDGKWLAYLQRSSDDKYSGAMNLWVVSSDGQQPKCLDTLPIAYIPPVWSPTDNSIAYQVLMSQANPAKRSLRIAAWANGEWQHHELLLPTYQPLGQGLAWFPDGKSLVVSREHDKDNLPRLYRVNLQGKSSCLFVLPADVAGNYQDGLYILDISDLKLSPDGHYLACFLGINSASLNADGMSLQIIDLQQESLSTNLGQALGYPQWVQWSPDSTNLAAILGNDRMASTNKHLEVVKIDSNSLHSKDLSRTSQVDSRPIWSVDGDTLYFSRGHESKAWLEEGRHQEVQVPGQQIYCSQDDQLQSLSQPGNEQADYPLSLSPDGQFLAMQRLNYIDQGDLYLMNLKDGRLVKLMEGIQANAGYYGSYLPEMISVYWAEKQ